MKRVAVIGSTGAIGSAVVDQIRKVHPTARIETYSRSDDPAAADTAGHSRLDLRDEESIRNAVSRCSQPLDFVFVATGMLHSKDYSPEKSLRDLSAGGFQELFAINTIGPALVAKYFVPRLRREGRTVFTALSARVGSIADNRLGGWHSYRASKAALNMIIRNISIEAARTNPESIVVGLHPGTVDSGLSRPFQRNLPEGQLITPEVSARQLLTVVDGLCPDHSGQTFALDGTQIPF